MYCQWLLRHPAINSLKSLHGFGALSCTVQPVAPVDVSHALCCESQSKNTVRRSSKDVMQRQASRASRHHQGKPERADDPPSRLLTARG